MLKKIIINSFVIFENLEINFFDGMTVITGITGSGKSVLFDAIEFALGNRVSRGLNKAQKPISVELVFNNFSIKHIKTNVSRFYLDGKLVSKLQVQEIASEMFCYQRQNYHLQSLDNAYQRQLLDSFGGHGQLIAKVNEIYQEWFNLNKNKKTLVEQMQNIEYELNKHYLVELQSLSPSAEDWLNLNSILHRAKNSKKDKEKNHNNQILLQQSIQNLEQVLRSDINENISKCLSEALVLCIDSEQELSEAMKLPEITDAMLYEAEERIQEYFKLARKHKVLPELLEKKFQELTATIDFYDELKIRINDLNAQIVKQENFWQQQSLNLAEKRQLSAKKLAPEIVSQLEQLSMNVRLEISFGFESQVPEKNGGGTLKFLISTKSTQPLKSVEKVLSGGEAARLALVMQKIRAHGRSGLIYLMDEVDVGVSGQVASAIGGLLKDISQENQVFCITHTPQVAAIAKHHICMTEKPSVILGDLRVKEIALMLCHSGITDAAMNQARELLSSEI